MAVRTGGWLYVTVELALEDQVRPVARTLALRAPVVEIEFTHDPDDYYHHYPPMERVRAWLADARFAIEEEAEEPWHEGTYGYHHVLARAEARRDERKSARPPLSPCLRRSR